MSAITIHCHGALYRCNLCGLRATDPNTLCEPRRITETSDHHYSTEQAIECYARKLVEPRLIIQA